MVHFDTGVRPENVGVARKQLNSLVKQPFVPIRDTLCATLAHSRTAFLNISSRSHPSEFETQAREIILAVKNCVESWADERVLCGDPADFLEERDAFRDYRSLY